jgi:hypothetical protein
MGHITLKIKNGPVTHPYVLFDAHFLREAWLSAAEPDGTTHIVKQFDCKKISNCFDEVANYLNSLGTVVEIRGAEIDHNHKLLQMILSDKSRLFTPRSEKIENLHQAITHGGRLCKKYISKMNPMALVHHVRNTLSSR